VRKGLARAIAKPPLDPALHRQLLDLFRSVDDVSGH
jgi:hypothetical protein